MVIAVIVGLVVCIVAGLLVLRTRSAKSSSLATDPRTHARDNADPARAVDQLRSQGNGAL